MKACVLDKVNLPQDTRFLYEAMTASDQYLYSAKLRFSSMERFEHWLYDALQGRFHDFYVVRNPHTHEAMGYVHNYDFSLIDGTCCLVAYMAPEHRNSGIGAYAAISFMKKLFYQYPLRKMYSTIYEYNKESMDSCIAAGFEAEGLLSDYRYHDGEYHGMYIMSMNRRDFEDKLERLVD